ncbi:hypothetical protein EBU24_03375 [bacterium]|nr:hypothetical protein [bacterium]
MLKKIIILNLLSGVLTNYATQNPTKNRRVSYSYSSSSEESDNKLELRQFIYVNSAHSHQKGAIDNQCSACRLNPEQNKIDRNTGHCHRLNEFTPECPDCKIMHGHDQGETCIFCDEKALKKIQEKRDRETPVGHIHTDNNVYEACPGCQEQQKKAFATEAIIDEELDAGCTIS